MNLSKLLLSEKTVFSIRDLELILGMENQIVRTYLQRLKAKNLVFNLFPGLWGINGREINYYELGCKLKSPSYISFETALQKYGVIFQDYSSLITLASNNTITKNINDKYYEYKKIKDTIFCNPIGITHNNTYTIASKERAICDIIYLKPGFTFDNLNNIDFEKLEEISKIYNKRTILEIKKIIKYA